MLRAFTTLGLFLVVVLMLSCSSKEQTRTTIHGSLPNWNLDEIVERSDAVVVAKVVREIGTKRIPGFGPGWDYVYKDYDLTVELAIYPASLPQPIAGLVEAGVASNDSTVRVSRPDGELLEFRVGERVMLFLESLKGEKFENTAGRPIPRGFTKETYYQVIISAGYGKLLPVGAKWKDSRVPKEVNFGEVTIAEVEQAVARVKRNP